MRKILAVATTAVLAAGGLACDTGAEADRDTGAPPAAEAAGETGTDAAGAATIGVATLEGAGPYLTDGSGRALYLLEGEPQDSSICYDQCAQEWPPFVAEQGAPRAGVADVREDLIGTLQRRDGTTQVTYAGHPLYYYHDDTEPGDTEGQDLTDQWGEWYLVQPSGEPLEEHGAHR